MVYVHKFKARLSEYNWNPGMSNTRICHPPNNWTSVARRPIVGNLFTFSGLFHSESTLVCPFLGQHYPRDMGFKHAVSLKNWALVSSWTCGKCRKSFSTPQNALNLARTGLILGFLFNLPAPLLMGLLEPPKPSLVGQEPASWVKPKQPPNKTLPPGDLQQELASCFCAELRSLVPEWIGQTTLNCH